MHCFKTFLKRLLMQILWSRKSFQDEALSFWVLNGKVRFTTFSKIYQSSKWTQDSLNHSYCNFIIFILLILSHLHLWHLFWQTVVLMLTYMYFSPLLRRMLSYGQVRGNKRAPVISTIYQFLFTFQPPIIHELMLTKYREQNKHSQNVRWVVEKRPHTSNTVKVTFTRSKEDRAHVSWSTARSKSRWCRHLADPSARTAGAPTKRSLRAPCVLSGHRTGALRYPRGKCRSNSWGCKCFSEGERFSCCPWQH